MISQGELMTAAEFAACAKVTIRAVRRWADKGIGPEPLRPPGARVVRYRRRDVDAWLSGESVRAWATS
jgi:hypothetical protein